MAAEWRQRMTEPSDHYALQTPEDGVKGFVDNPTGESHEDESTVVKKGKRERPLFGDSVVFEVEGCQGTTRMRNFAKEKVQDVLWTRLEQRHEHQRKLVRLQTARRNRLADVPETEREAIREAFDIYKNVGSNCMRVEDLTRCLMELGLSGKTSQERFAVERMCDEIFCSMVKERSIETSALDPALGGLRQPIYKRLGPALRVGGKEDHASTSQSPGQPRQPRKSLSRGIPMQHRASKVAPTMLSASCSDSATKLAAPGRASIVARRSVMRRGTGSLQPTHVAHRTNSVQRRTIGARASIASRGSIAPTGGIAVRATRSSPNRSKKSDDSSTASVRNFPITLEDLAVEIIPVVRRQLMECRMDRHFVEFQKELTATSVTLSLQQAMCILKRVVLDDEAVAEVLNELELTAESQGEEEHLDFSTLHHILMQTEENAERRTHKLERELMRKTELSEDMFWHFRLELFSLHTTYRMFDSTRSGWLSLSETRMLFRQTGLVPHSRSEEEFLTRLLKESDINDDLKISFFEFLHMMDKIRIYQKGQRREKLRAIFLKHDRGVHGIVDKKDVIDLALVAGIALDTEPKKLAAARQIEEFTTERFGDVSFAEFEELVQMIVEGTLQVTLAEIREEAKRLGLSDEKFAMYQWTYDQLDEDKSGGLSFQEILVVLAVYMKRPPSNKEVLGLYEQLGVEVETELTIIDFLRLMHHAINAGLFEKDPPFTLMSVPSAKLQELLRVFPIERRFIDSLTDHDQLAGLVADYVEVGVNADLREIKLDGQSVNNMRQLTQLARRKAGSELDI
eukprot:TRINITY_DN37094_c0_g2_i1.p1 TRINITY_DN37094_c0_g2~~TRINITY_DN37094_c0_g2_i1.p1  ORF type:complete len:914 (-),score=175.35 TRINITY_DN37094_c0_g2_i1:86-2476(-)